MDLSEFEIQERIKEFIPASASGRKEHAEVHKRQYTFHRVCGISQEEYSTRETISDILDFVYNENSRPIHEDQFQFCVGKNGYEH